MTCPHEVALAEILLLVEREGNGEDLDDRDPQVVVAAVKRRLELRGKAPKKRKAVRRVSKRRRAKQQARKHATVPAPTERSAVIGAEDPNFRVFVVRLACCIELIPSKTGVDPAHLRGKRMWGDWLADEDGKPVGNIFPARRRYHTEQHDTGVKTFAEKHRLDLAKVCRVVGEGYLLGLEPEQLSALAKAANGYQHVDLSSWRSASTQEAGASE